jgi:hypothetical protein
MIIKTPNPTKRIFIERPLANRKERISLKTKLSSKCKFISSNICGLKKITILTVGILFNQNAICQDTLEPYRKNSFIDFSLSLGNSGYSLYYSGSSPEVRRKYKDYGLSFRVGTKWELKELSNNYSLGIQCNWFRLKGSYGYGTVENVGTNWGIDTIDVIQFDASLFNLGIVNQINIGQTSIQLNFNTGPTVFYYSKVNAVAAGLAFNPEIKLFFNDLYFGLDYSLISILYHSDPHFGIYRNYSCFSIGKKF